MLLCAFSALLSMLISSKRLPGRSWQAEYMSRVMRLFFKKAATMPTQWSRAEFEKISPSKSAMAKLDFANKSYADVPCLVVTPEATTESLICVYLHGGAYVSGSPKGYTNAVSNLAKAINAQVVVADYRLSPEHVFPAAQDDCLTITTAVIAQHPQAKIALIGDSAGAALAITTALSLGASDKLDSLTLISPWVDPNASSGSMLSNDEHDIFSKEFLDQAYAAHIGNADPLNTRSSFTSVDLSSLPRTYIQAGGAELFIDQIIEFSERATAQGVDLEFDNYPSMFHVFQLIAPGLEESKAAINKIATFVRR